MWLFFGIIAAAAAVLNVIWTIKGGEARWFRFISLSFTAFTLCAFYSADAKWVLSEDWSALLDVTPVMSKALWIGTVISIVINSVSLFKSPKK